MSDIYVPINYSDINKIIPPGEEIIYSTLCKGVLLLSQGTKSITYKWKTHVLITPNGIAYTKPNTLKKKAVLQEYSTWDEIYRIISVGKFGIGFSLRKAFDFKLIRDVNFETKEKFNERSKEFVAKFRPLLIKKKEQWLELNRNNPDIKKRRINKIKKSLAINKQLEEKRKAKEAKRKVKEMKKK